MLSLGHPDQDLPRHLLKSPGGFAWWYADLIDANGSGLVCIWSYGLPFLPGYLSSYRQGEGQLCGSRPSVNLAVYDHGKTCFYSLLELEPSRAMWGERSWKFGDCHFQHQHVNGQTRLQADIDLPVPGRRTRLTGTFHIQGPATSVRQGTASPSSAHVWTPIVGPANGSATLCIGEQPLLDVHGSGYHDRNGSTLPLDGLGIDHWTWGRQVIGDRLLIYYLTWPIDRASEPLFLAYEINSQGVMRTVELVDVELGRQHIGRFGMPWWESLTLHGHERPLIIDVQPPADDGPFYLRCTTRANVGGVTARGWTELCRPRRVDTMPLRPLVQMSVQQEQGANSMWLPLFVGSQADRFSRLASWWRNGQGREPRR